MDLRMRTDHEVWQDLLSAWYCRTTSGQVCRTPLRR
jgi:hypothetical protein